MTKQKRLTRDEVMARESEIRSKVEKELFGREISQPEIAQVTCSAHYSAFTGLVKCPCKPLRIITYMVADEPVSGDYCAKHAIELRRDEVRGKLEILSDEPLYPMPLDKPVAVCT